MTETSSGNAEQNNTEVYKTLENAVDARTLIIFLPEFLLGFVSTKLLAIDISDISSGNEMHGKEKTIQGPLFLLGAARMWRPLCFLPD